MLPYHCGFCLRSFKYVDLYRHHALTCEYLSAQTRTKQALSREQDFHEDRVPSMQEMFKYCQYLAVQCDKLRKDVEALKAAACKSSRKRKLEHIRDRSVNVVPAMLFETWIQRDNMAVTPDMLKEVWRSDLLGGMKRFLKHECDSFARNLPVRCFATKPPVLFYIYTLPLSSATSSSSSSSISISDPADARPARPADASPKWRVLTYQEWKRWIEKIEHRFLQEYLELSPAQMQAILNDDRAAAPAAVTPLLQHHLSKEKEKDREIKFMLKISDCQENVSRRRMQEIRKWIVPLIFHDIFPPAAAEDDPVDVVPAANGEEKEEVED